MTEQPTITITLPMNSVDLGGALDAARALTSHLEAAQEMVSRLAELLPGGGGIAPAAPADRPPPRAVAETNGHGPKPKRHRGPLTSPARARRYSAEEKAGAVARAAEVGIREAAAEVGALPSSVQRWIDAHPKEHAAGRINGTPPAVGESREDWEARKREAAGSSL